MKNSSTSPETEMHARIPTSSLERIYLRTGHGHSNHPGIGILFSQFLYLAYLRAEETRSWTAVHCLIEESDVDWSKISPNSPLRYFPKIRYRYRVGEQSYLSRRLTRSDGSTSDKAKVKRHVWRPIPSGSTHLCFVDPKDPEFAILEHEPLAPIYSIWFPCLFILGGIGMIVGGARRREGGSGKTPLSNQPPATRR